MLILDLTTGSGEFVVKGWSFTWAKAFQVADGELLNPDEWRAAQGPPAPESAASL